MNEVKVKCFRFLDRLFVDNCLLLKKGFTLNACPSFCNVSLKCFFDFEPFVCLTFLVLGESETKSEGEEMRCQTLGRKLNFFNKQSSVLLATIRTVYTQFLLICAH